MPILRALRSEGWGVAAVPGHEVNIPVLWAVVCVSPDGDRYCRACPDATTARSALAHGLPVMLRLLSKHRKDWARVAKGS